MPTEEEAQRWSRAADEKLRKMFMAQARRKCDDKVREFVECSKENGLMVIFRCREQNKEMNACVSQFSSEAQWEEYRETKIREYVRDGKVSLESAPTLN